MRRIGLVAALVLTLTLAVGRVPRAQTSLSISALRVGAAGVVAVSPSVMATFQFLTGDATLLRMQSLVLWRGSAGWYTRRTTTQSPPAPQLPLMTGSLWITRNTVGGVDLSVTSDVSTSLLLVHGQTFDLRQGNVVLVDAVDQGPTVVDTMRIEAQVPAMSGAEVLVPVFAGVPALSAFLRCEVPLPPGAPRGGANLCAAVRR
jgi:hypothetical protein